MPQGPIYAVFPLKDDYLLLLFVYFLVLQNQKVIFWKNNNSL